MSKSLFRVIAPLILVLALAGCTPLGSTGGRLVGSGKAVTRDFQLAGFYEVSIDSAFEVSIARGDSFKVSVTTDDNLLDYAKVTKEGSTLKIRFETGTVTSFSSRIQKASITMPELVGVRLNGASQASMSGFKQVAAFEAGLDGASKLTGDVQAGVIRLTSNGASTYTLSGTAGSLTLTGDGASRFDLGKLAADKA